MVTLYGSISTMSAETLPLTETDRRYRVLVLLQRADRPRLAKFHCPYCKSFVAEEMNTEFQAMTDVIDFENTATMGIGVRCNGSLGPGKGHCRTWWYFTLGAK